MSYLIGFIIAWAVFGLILIIADEMGGAVILNNALGFVLTLPVFIPCLLVKRISKAVKKGG